MANNDTTYTEHELAVLLDVAPCLVVYLCERGEMEAERDELGWTITEESAGKFEDEFPNTLSAAKLLTATTLVIGVARATLRRAEGKERGREGG